MKVFLSWSGDLSRAIACSFRDWLPSVIQSVKPYVSSEDIDKGTRWSTDIAQELEESSFGILCITKENINAPWINFEAGALSKTIDKARVSPFLFDVKRSEVQGPLLQFQSTIYDKGDIGKLVLSINNFLLDDDRLVESRLDKAFQVWWPQLDRQLTELRDNAPQTSEMDAGKQPADAAILEELLELARNQQKLLRSPEALLPPDYLSHVLRDMTGRSGAQEVPVEAVDELVTLYLRMRDLMKSAEDMDVPDEERSMILERMGLALTTLLRSVQQRPRKAPVGIPKWGADHPSQA